MIFVDVNVVEDVLEKRRGWRKSLAVLTLVRKGTVQGYLSALTVPVLYFLQRNPDVPARRNVLTATAGFKILDLTSDLLTAAFKEKRIPDFEDAIQFLSAKEAGLEMLVTRNVRHFKAVQTEIQVLTPLVYLPSGKLSRKGHDARLSLSH